MFCKKKVLLRISQYSQANTCVGVSLKIELKAFRPAALLKRGSTQVFSYEYYEIFQNIYFAENLHMGASERTAKNLLYLIFTSPYKSWTFNELVMGKYKSKVNDSDI